MTGKQRWLLALSAVGVLAAANHARAEVDEQAAFRRWAIVAAKDLEASGFPDLLTVKLSQQPGFDLVERSELDRVADERQLTLLWSPAGSAERLRLGRQLDAHALVLLSRPEAEKGLVRLVVCECRQGARLLVSQIDLAGDVEQAARRVTSQLGRVRQHFAGGVKLLIGVPPFLSQNLEHDYDHLQSRWSGLLGNALSLSPGVAVVEVEEARAIVKEQRRSAQEPSPRSVPFLVHARFRMRRESDLPIIDMHVALQKAEASQDLKPISLSLHEAPRWIVDDLARQLIQASKQPFKRLSNLEQKSALVSRAVAFSDLGDWRHAVGLREAVLALDPSDVPQRLELVNEYQRIWSPKFAYVWLRSREPAPRRKQIFQSAVDDYLAMLEHLEHLIRNRQVPREKAIELFDAHGWHDYTGYGAMLHELDPSPERKGHVDLVRAAERRFVTTVFPKALKLPPREEPLAKGERPRILRYGERSYNDVWTRLVLKCMANEVKLGKCDQASLDYFHLVLSDVLPDEPIRSRQTIDYFLHNAYGPIASFPHRASPWVATLRSLEKSDRVVARLIGRVGLFQHSIKKPLRSSPPPRDKLRALVREADEILAELRRLRRESGALHWRVSRSRQELLWKLDPPPDSPKPPKAESLGRLRFRQLTLSVAADRSAQPMPLRGKAICGIRNCDDRFDLVWTEDQLLVMREPGLLQPLPLSKPHKWLAAAEPRLGSAVAWDGELIWVGTAGEGVEVFTPGGEAVASLGEESGLPASDQGLRILGLAPRKVLAVGSFGALRRAWCAVVEIDEQDKLRVKVFHEATRVPRDPQRKDRLALDPQMTFTPKWIHRYDDGPRSRAIVGRKPGLESNGYPLAVDLGTLKASVLQRRVNGGTYHDSFFSRSGNLFQATHTKLMRFSMDASPGEGPVQELCQSDPRLKGVTHNLYAQAIPHDGWLYITGYMWFRVHQETLREERLVETMLPQPFRSTIGGVSAHYGLIAWRRSSLFDKQQIAPVYAVTVAGSEKK